MAKGEVWPDRKIFHRWMGPEDSCDKCYGRGITYVLANADQNPDVDNEDWAEAYCDCPCGELKRKLETE